MKIAKKYFANKGYDVKDVSGEKLGWDITAILDEKKILVEVKGLSANIIAAELTPNEYSKLKEQRDNYRIFVVTNALSERQAKYHIFLFNTETGEWEDQYENVLKIERRTGAVISSLQ